MDELYLPDMGDEIPDFVDGLADNFSLLEGSLVEYGSNENGEYWRWENGLQVCTRSVTLDITNTDDQHFQFAAQFSASPSASMSFAPGLNTSYRSFIRSITLSSSTTRLTVMKGTTASASASPQRAVAIGRWR
jgi:hypothetical protein